LYFGERPEVAYVLPISVDGMLIVASTAMVDDKRAGREVRWSARIAFAAGVGASVGANIAAAQPTIGARIVAAWPAVALLLVVEMLSRVRSPARDQASTASPDDFGTDDRSENKPSAIVSSLDIEGDKSASAPVRTSPLRDRQTPASDALRPTRRHSSTADVVARVRAERPDARLADIAAEAGVSERHVRRLLMSDTNRIPAASANGGPDT
jgi:hypothetical protein